MSVSASNTESEFSTAVVFLEAVFRERCVCQVELRGKKDDHASGGLQIYLLLDCLQSLGESVFLPDV